MAKLPRPVKTLGFDEAMKMHKKKMDEAQAYVLDTGLCFKCKTNPVRENDIVCQECYDKTEIILGKFRGMDGFVKL